MTTCRLSAPSYNLSTPSSRASWSQSPTTNPGSSSHLPPPTSSHLLSRSNGGGAGLREVEGGGPVLSTEALGDAEGRQRDERRNPAAARLRGWHQKMRCKQQFWAERSWHHNRKWHSVLQTLSCSCSHSSAWGAGGQTGVFSFSGRFTAQLTSSRDRLLAR